MGFFRSFGFEAVKYQLFRKTENPFFCSTIHLNFLFIFIFVTEMYVIDLNTIRNLVESFCIYYRIYLKKNTKSNQLLFNLISCYL